MNIMMLRSSREPRYGGIFCRLDGEQESKQCWKICEQAERGDITLCLTETGKVEIISELSNSHITEIAVK